MLTGTVQKTQPKITSVSVGSTETSHVFTTKVRAFQVHCEDYYDIRWAWVSGETANSGDYMTLKVGTYWWEDDVFNGGTTWTLYLRCPDIPSGSANVQIQEWF